MERVHQAALDKIAKWDAEKFERSMNYLKTRLHKSDFVYLMKARHTMKEHGETFPRLMAFTLR